MEKFDVLVLGGGLAGVSAALRAAELGARVCLIEKDYFVDGDKKLQVTIGIGGAIITKDDTEMSLFERADKAMCRAKNNGRNQVVMDL